MSDVQGQGSKSGEIFIVEDDPSVRDALTFVFTEAGYQVTSFLDGPSFLFAARERVPAAVIMDVYLPGRSGLDILKDIDAPRYEAPIFVASARSDIPMAVEALKRGAVDFFEKRGDLPALVDRVSDAIRMRANGHEERGAGGLKSFPGRELLTPREISVVALIIAGASNQQAADELHISRRTVEVHRAHIMAKLKARNAADLVRIVLNSGRS